MDIQHEMVQSLSKKYNDELEKAVKVCLEKRGFTFESPLDFHAFLNTRCRVDINRNTKEQTFFVDESPVFVWSELSEAEFKIEDNGNVPAFAYRTFRCL